MFKALLLASLATSAVVNASPYKEARGVSPIPTLSTRQSSGCGTSAKTSCSTSSTDGTCCFEAPGGLLLQTQFWDTDPVTGPDDSWTIHGLWPDHCDGTFDENCDSSRDYKDITSLLTDQGATDTLDFMKDYWQDISGSDEDFWEHEWSTHGTCYSTLEPSCLASGSPKGAEAVAFFNTVVKLFKTLTTYDWLSDAGITPSSSKTHTLTDLVNTLSQAAGATPALDCDGSNLSGISYYFHVKGSVIDGTFTPVDAIESSSCPKSGIKYLPKNGSGNRNATTAAANKRRARN